jgi:hypothetical protein
MPVIRAFGRKRWRPNRDCAEGALERDNAFGRTNQDHPREGVGVGAILAPDLHDSRKRARRGTWPWAQSVVEAGRGVVKTPTYSSNAPALNKHGVELEPRLVRRVHASKLVS